MLLLAAAATASPRPGLRWLGFPSPAFGSHARLTWFTTHRKPHGRAASAAPDASRGAAALLAGAVSRALAPRSSGAAQAVRSLQEGTIADLIGIATRLDDSAGRTKGHAARTAFLALRIASALGLRDSQHRELLYAALLKDLSVLPPAGSPRCDSHGAVSLDSLETPHAALVAIAAIDDRWDGRGGSADARGASIPLASRILAVAEAAEIGASRGGPSAAVRSLRAARGRSLDPEIVDLVLEMGRLGLWRELDGGAVPGAWPSWRSPAAATPTAGGGVTPD